MSTTTGTASASAIAIAMGLAAGHPFKITQLAGHLTLSGDLTMDDTYRNILAIDPAGARNVLLPPEQDGLWYWIVNKADAAENITVKDDSGGTTVVTCNQNDSALVWCDGTTWRLVCVIPINLT